MCDVAKPLKNNQTSEAVMEALRITVWHLGCIYEISHGQGPRKAAVVQFKRTPLGVGALCAIWKGSLGKFNVCFEIGILMQSSGH